MSEFIVEGERRSILIAPPKRTKVASIGLEINNMASAIVSDGTWLLYRGIRAKRHYSYFQEKIEGLNH